MNNNVTSSKIQLEAEELKKLVSEVKETVATDLHEKKTSEEGTTFSVADLWNIQRNRRSRYSRREML